MEQPAAAALPLSRRDMDNIVRHLKVVVQVVDKQQAQRASTGRQLAQMQRIQEIQRKIKQVEYKALVHQMEARLAQMKLQHLELQQLIQYAHKLMDIRKRERELLTLTQSISSRIDGLKEQMRQVEEGSVVAVESS